MTISTAGTNRAQKIKTSIPTSQKAHSVLGLPVTSHIQLSPSQNKLLLSQLPYQILININVEGESFCFGVPSQQLLQDVLAVLFSDFNNSHREMLGH